MCEHAVSIRRLPTHSAPATTASTTTLTTSVAHLFTAGSLVGADLAAELPPLHAGDEQAEDERLDEGSEWGHVPQPHPADERQDRHDHRGQEYLTERTLGPAHSQMFARGPLRR